MSRILSVAVALGVAVSSVAAQGIPLAQKRFTYDALPYQADTDTGERGTQFGYNICNATTENQQSLCQTALINTLDDFCLWGPPEPNSLIGDTEGEAVAWCTKAGRGTRLIPQGALTGVQFMRTPDYIQVVGHIDQALINIAADDSGGEMDPHGADQRGNPLGGLLFSNAFGGAGFTQVVEWHNFMGGGVFCLKACDPAGANAARFCEHVYDRIGCTYNAPAAYVDGVFESCQGENQDFPGIYTENGAVVTYQQPPESLGPISTLPYIARIPASSNCVAGTSSVLYAGAPTATGVRSSSVVSTASSSASGVSTARPTTTGSVTRSVSPSGTAGASNGAAAIAMSGAAALIGVFAVAVAAF